MPFDAGTWTITYNGAEQTAAAWGLTADPRLSLPLNEAKRMTWFMAGAEPSAGAPFPFEAPVTIKLYGAAGAVAFTLIGYHLQPKDVAVPGRRGIVITFEDTWYKFKVTPWTQQWPVPNTQPQQYYNLLRNYLFQDPAAPALNFHMTFATQLIDIINYAAGQCGINCQPGNIDNQQVMPWYGVTCQFLADAIKKCCAFFPGMKFWFDDSSGTPTFNCRFRANCAAVTLPYAGMLNAAGAPVSDPAQAQYIHKSSPEITPRYDLQASGVVLQYQTTESFDGVDYPEFAQVVYPPGATITQPRVVAALLDLRGSRVTSAKGKTVAQGFNPNSLDFWRGNTATGQRGKVPSLGDADVAGLAFVPGTNVTITDVNGNPVNLALYPNEFRSGCVYSWMGVTLLTDVRVTAHLKYTRNKSVGGTQIQREGHNDHVHTVNVKLSSAPIGTTYYSVISQIVYGESPVLGLEQTIYQDRSVLMFSGSHEIIELGTPAIIGPWNLLTLTGGDPAWANMDIYNVEIDFMASPTSGAGVSPVWRNTTIAIGPAKHLSPADLNSYLQLFRGKVVINNPSDRISGGSSNQVDVAGDTPQQDTTPSTPDEIQRLYSAPAVDQNNNPVGFTTINHDASAGQIQIQPLNPAGAVDPGRSQITLNVKAASKFLDTHGSIIGGTMVNGVLVGGAIDSQDQPHTIEVWQLTTCEDDGTGTGNTKNFTRLFLCSERFLLPGQ